MRSNKLKHYNKKNICAIILRMDHNETNKMFEKIVCNKCPYLLDKITKRTIKSWSGTMAKYSV